MTINLVLFLISQVLLFVGATRSLTLLSFKNLLATPLGVVTSSSYLYLFIYYGPLTLYSSLGPEYALKLASMPWFHEPSTFRLSLLLGQIQISLPYLLARLAVRNIPHTNKFFFRRLEPLFASKSTLAYGLLGTINQLLMVILFSNQWNIGTFRFDTPILYQKLMVAAFLLGIFTPQLALYLYANYNRQTPTYRPIYRFIFITSFVVAFVAFSVFSMRTYLICLVFLSFGAFVAESNLLRYKKGLIITLLIAPVAFFVAFSSASIGRRIQYSANPLSTTVNLAQRLAYDLSYRSGFGTDSAVLHSKTCIRSELAEVNRTPLSIIPYEMASGLPSFLREIYSSNYNAGKLEALIQNCYQKSSKQKRPLRLDLLDIKSEYFLASFDNPFLATFLSSVIWPLASLLLIYIIVSLSSVFGDISSFMVVALIHPLVFATTPGEYISLFKLLAIYLPLICSLRLASRLLAVRQ